MKVKQLSSAESLQYAEGKQEAKLEPKRVTFSLPGEPTPVVKSVSSLKLSARSNDSSSKLPAEQKPTTPQFTMAAFWEDLPRRIELLTRHLLDSAYVDNMETVRQVNELYSELEFPFSGNGAVAKVLMLRYLTHASLASFNFERTQELLTLYKQAIVARMHADEMSGAAKVASKMQANMVQYSYMLLLKTRYRTLVGDYESALKPLFKLERLLEQHALNSHDQ